MLLSVAVMSNITPITHFHQNQEDKIQDINDRVSNPVVFGPLGKRYYVIL